MPPRNENRETWIQKLMPHILLALLVGGSAPWWWDKLPGKKSAPPVVDVAPTPPQENSGDGNTQALPQETARPVAPANSFIPLWQCIPPKFRPEGATQEVLAATQPDSMQLNSGLLWMVQDRQPGCVQTLLSAGANVDAYKVPANLNFADGPPLHLAIVQKDWSMSTLLLQRGANPNLETTFDGYSALELARNANAPPELITALQKRGAR